MDGGLVASGRAVHTMLHCNCHRLPVQSNSARREDHQGRTGPTVTFRGQKDAHGVTGRWGEVTLRDCEIHHVSGDAVQFDPDRKPTGRVLIEHCTFWRGPLAADAAGFRKGERPGENAVDTKTMPKGERCTLTIRDCYFHGRNRPAQISNAAALNLQGERPRQGRV